MKPVGDSTRSIRVTVNGRDVERDVSPRVTLAAFLREGLGLTGTHVGCEQGFCGACTVLLDGATARSCLTLAVQADGCSVTTVEGLADDPVGAALQDAFVRHHAQQCGFCTPGVLSVATEVVTEARAGATFDRATVRERMAAAYCRCTGYAPIISAVEEVVADDR